MTIASVGSQVLIISVGPLAVLFLHRAGLANTLRRVGHWFLSAADAVDFMRVRYRELNSQFERSREVA